MTYIEPALPLLLLIGLIGLIRTWRTAGGHRPWLETFALAGIAVLSTNAGAWVLSRPLEGGYRREAVPTGTADAIVVMAGAVNAPQPVRPYHLAGQDTYRRVRHAAWLFHHWKALPVLVSGGGRSTQPHAATMRQLLESERVPAELIWMESRSTNTHEGARYAAEILRAHGITRIALVVEANSMPRAARSFEQHGITVVPAPARFVQLSGDFHDFLPGWRAVALNSETLHEVVGLAWYRLRGRI